SRAALELGRFHQAAASHAGGGSPSAQRARDHGLTWGHQGDLLSGLRAAPVRHAALRPAHADRASRRPLRAALAVGQPAGLPSLPAGGPRPAAGARPTGAAGMSAATLAAGVVQVAGLVLAP